MKKSTLILDNKIPTPSSEGSPLRIIANKQIIKSLNILRKDIKSKDYSKRMEILLDKSQELVRLGCFIKDPATKVSNIALRLLQKMDPSLIDKQHLEESDWEDKELIFNSVLPVPQKRNDKAPTIWESTAMQVKRIPDTRGADSKIVVYHPVLKSEIRTPWYTIPNIVDPFGEISDKLGPNAALLLINQQTSRAKANEPHIP